MPAAVQAPVAANGCIVVGWAGALNWVVDSGSKVVSGTLTPGPGAGGALAFTAFFLLFGVLLESKPVSPAPNPAGLP